jgi:hypothetical protein
MSWFFNMCDSNIHGEIIKIVLKLFVSVKHENILLFSITDDNFRLLDHQ